MGVVRDGTVSGNLPSDEVFAVHYPGYPSSMSRAIQTLGGSQGILKAHTSQSNKLELHFRPEDSYSHPAFGELHPCANLVLKISRKMRYDGSVTGSCRDTGLEQKNSLRGSGERSRHDIKTNIFADIVARVSDAYHFTGMVDYQHVLAVNAACSLGKRKKWAEMQPETGKDGLMGVEHEDVMMLVPPLFSLKDVPEKLVLRQSSTLSSRKQEGVVQQRWEMDIERCLALEFNIKEVPKKINWQDHIPEGSDQWKVQIAVSKLFDERPIWPKSSVNACLLDQNIDLGDFMLRRLLFRVAYYFSSGPFLRFWIRKGYDPRQDCESRIYQRIDFRVPIPLRNYCEANAAKRPDYTWKDLCAFKAFPYKCHTYLQLFELADDYIQEEIRKPVKQAKCNDITGWFSYGILDSLRLCVGVRFLSVYPNPGAEELLKFTSMRFERSKKTPYNKSDLRSHEDRRRQVAQGVEDKEEAGDIDAENNGVGDDISEEGEDGYEIDDDEISLQSHAYTDGDNVSRNYLQELFGAFPSYDPDGGCGVGDDGSDVEYPIYEQDSEGQDLLDDY